MRISVLQASAPGFAKKAGESQFFCRHTAYRLFLLLAVYGALSSWPVIAQESTDVSFVDSFENLACADDFDADGDGYPGYPTDPGCTSLADNDEVDDCPSGPGCSQCANTADDDGDGFIDFPSDPGCTAASDSDELNP